jgi:AraC-like DNA-binding protein
MSTPDGPAEVNESVRVKPSPGLRPYIAWYSGYRQSGMPPASHRGLPSPYLTLIVTFDEPLVVARHPDPTCPAGSYDTLVGGLHTRPALIVHDGRQAGVQLAVSPLGARALLGLPAGALAGADLDAGLVLGPVAAQLHERVSAARSWPERFAVLDAVLLRHARLDQRPRPELAHAWQRLLATGGQVPIAELADEVGWTSRHLRARFHAEIGLTPKAAARIVRFDRARRRLQHEHALAGSPALARIAPDFGYFDQAHLAREFRALAGCAPSQWLAEEFRNVQAEPDAALAESWA